MLHPPGNELRLLAFNPRRCCTIITLCTFFQLLGASRDISKVGGHEKDGVVYGEKQDKSWVGQGGCNRTITSGNLRKSPQNQFSDVFPCI